MAPCIWCLYEHHTSDRLNTCQPFLLLPDLLDKRELVAQIGQQDLPHLAADPAALYQTVGNVGSPVVLLRVGVGVVRMSMPQE